MKKAFDNKYVKVIGCVLVSILLMFLGTVVGMGIGVPFHLSDNTSMNFMGNYFAFIGIWIVTIAYCLIKKEKPLLSKLGRGGKGNNILTSIVLGLTFGIGLNLLVAFAAMLNGDIQLYFVKCEPGMVLAFLLCIGFQSGAEELLDRFFIYQKVKELFPEKPIVPIIVNSFVFACIHLFNGGITVISFINITLVGVLYSLFIYYFDSFWGAVIAHTTWNFCQNILLGLPNSGIVSAYSVFALDASTAADSFCYNVNFGIEGSLLATVLLSLSCVIIALIGRKKMVKSA